jgi:ABC-type dipeptide/oligopeptide/nickel transport system permease component
MQKSISIKGRTGDPVFAGYIARAAYRKLQDISKETGSIVIPRVTLSVNLRYPVVETANILGILKGRSTSDRVLMISANLDGLGMSPQGQVFGGAVHEATSIAATLELGRLLSIQDNLPYRHIVFAFWNGQHQDYAGSSYYLAHPLFPLEKTTLIHLDSIGLPSQKGLQIQADSRDSAILKDKFLLHAKDLGLSIDPVGPVGFIANRFVDNKVPSVTLSDASGGAYPFNTVLDIPERVDKDALENAVRIVTGFIGGELYTNPWPDYLHGYEIALIATLLLAAFFNLFTEHQYRTDPAVRMLGTTAESLYFSIPVVLIRKFYERVFPYLLVLFLLAFLVNVRQTTDIRYVNGEAVTNFSLPLTVKQSVISLRSLLSIDAGIGQRAGNTLKAIRGFSLKSLALIGSSLVLALTSGLAGGLVESYRSKTLQLRSLGALVLFSIPDVFVVLILLLAYTSAYLAYPVLGDLPWLKGFVLPLVALSVIPAIYISRMTVVAVREELRKDYIRAAKASGYSRVQLYTREMMPGILAKLLDALPTLMTIIFSNMIIVEYLFNYNGIGYFLLYLYKRQDIARFVPMAIVLGLIYAVFTGGIRQLGKVLHLVHREELQ